MKKIYLDYAATSIKRKKILQEIINRSELFDGNPGSLHFFGRESKRILEDSRVEIAKSIGADPNEIIFTSGASESNNTVLSAFDDEAILTSNIEHDSIENAIDYNKATIVKANRDGLISTKDVIESINDSTRLISIMMVNNEIGTIQPIQEIGTYLKDKDIKFHVDAVQAYGHIDIDVNSMNIDFLSLSGHKIGGVNGFGVLFARESLPSFIKGGEQEKNRRAGTSYVMGAFSMAKSYPYMRQEREHIKELKSYLLKRLDESKISYEVNGLVDNSSSHILNIYLENMRADFILTFLDMRGIAVSAGSACRAGSLLPSKVVSRVYDKKRALSSIRISLGFENTREDIDRLIEALEEVK